jgi:hypothetical protein
MLSILVTSLSLCATRPSAYRIIEVVDNPWSKSVLRCVNGIGLTFIRPRSIVTRSIVTLSMSDKFIVFIPIKDSSNDDQPFETPGIYYSHRIE